MASADLPLGTSIERIRSEYLEMPGLALTQRQAERLFGLDDVTCRALLDTLSQVGFLQRNDRGEYIRSGRGL